MLHNHLKIKSTRPVGEYAGKCYILKQPAERLGLVALRKVALRWAPTYLHFSRWVARIWVPSSFFLLLFRIFQKPLGNVVVFDRKKAMKKKLSWFIQRNSCTQEVKDGTLMRASSCSPWVTGFADYHYHKDGRGANRKTISELLLSPLQRVKPGRDTSVRKEDPIWGGFQGQMLITRPSWLLALEFSSSVISLVKAEGADPS